MSTFIKAIATTQTLSFLHLTPSTSSLRRSGQRSIAETYERMLTALISTASPTLQTLVLRDCPDAVAAGLQHNRSLLDITLPKHEPISPVVAKLLARNRAMRAMRTMVMCARRKRLPFLAAELYFHVFRFIVPEC